jgi:hypothetical protein
VVLQDPADGLALADLLALALAHGLALVVLLVPAQAQQVA